MDLDLYMLGVIHRDPRGGERLRQALAGLPWGLVSVEVSPYALAFRRREGPALWTQAQANLPRAAALAGLSPEEARAHPALAWLKAYLDQPCEWTVSLAQARARRAPCLALDLSALSRGLLADAHELVSVENLAHLLASRQPAGAEMERRRARDLLAGRGGWPRPSALEPGREALLARRLTRLAAAAGRRGLAPLVHVGGWRHLLRGQDPPSLADRLGVDPARRVLV